MDELHQFIREQIAEVRQGRSKILDLNHWRITGQLKEIPEEIFDLSQLEELHLGENQIRIIPERLRELPNLKRLNLIGNPIQKVPDIPGLILDWDGYLRCRQSLSPGNVLGIYVSSEERLSKASQLLPTITSLLNLRHLIIGVARLAVRTDTKISKPTAAVRKLIDSLGQLDYLEELTLFGMLLGETAPGIRNMKRLRRLNLTGTGLRELPAWLSELQELTELSLGINELERLPDSLAHLSSLKAIFLSGNRFAEIPGVLFHITSLTHLDLSAFSTLYEGQIKQIPPEILELTNLKTLDIKGQPIETPPPEVVKQGMEAIRNYWRQQQEAGVDYLCEAKLLIVGEAGAGKTSLAKKISDRNYQLQHSEASTEGIEVIRWGFPTAVRVKHNGEEKLFQHDFRVNIWDFGGQEIYHATHQFFLTRRSLYALVADDRKEDTDFNYWLQVVELLSDGSPLLIVQNEKQDRQRALDLGRLRTRFPNLKETYRINLATNRGLDDLVNVIRQELERLSHIGVPLPQTWKRVREALEQNPCNYINIDEYFTICQTHGFKRHEDKLQLSSYLHDLGICLHFQDDPVLKKTVILKPKWGTDAVYRVLDDRTVIENHGRFDAADLARIWSEDTYAPMRDELLRLMLKFQLCYQLPEGGAYIAPQLLSPTQPVYNWDVGGNLILYYEYDFMPKGMITRFIVALHHLIADQRLVWKSGVILEREGTRAEVIEDYPKRKIAVRVAGPDTRGLLAIIDDQLERIHHAFSRLQYEKFLPCNCPVCQKRSEPFAYPLSTLKDFAQTGDGIQCHVSRKLVDAAALIRDIFPAALRVAAWRVSDQEIMGHGEDPAPEPELRKEVFVSYAWTDESKAIVDQIEKALQESGIMLIRDRNEVKYKDSIRAFMQRIGRGKCIVVILSKRYLESKNCMFELTEIAARKDIHARVFPVVLEGTNIYEALGRLRYIKYWETKKAELDSEMKEVGGEYLDGIREELDLYAKIRATIADIMNILGDMNALTPESHRASNFQELLRTLEARLSE